MSTSAPHDADASLAEFVTNWPAAAAVFHRHRLDYCCGGHHSLTEACRERGLDPARLIDECRTESEGGSPEAGIAGWEERPLDELVDHIISRYHQQLREELPRLIALASKIERVHGDKPDCPHGVADQFVRMAAAIEEHLDKEEQVLFPLIRAGRGRDAAMPVRCMEEEHDDHGGNLRKLRALARDYQLPAGACASWWSLYDGLQRLERELMDHIHLENNILFPRALRAEGDG